MPNLNKVMLMGNLTRDPEVRFTTNNTAVGNFSIAVNRTWKGQDGQKQEEVTFIDCEAWGRTAEVIADYLRKGRPLFVEGRLKLDQWEDQEGQKRSKLKVVVERFEFIDSSPGSSGTPGSSRNDRGNDRANSGSTSGNPWQQPQHTIDEEDIPF